ncbi:gluzincin family metallopeptidase [Pyxidicoccus xibeiensis]|uniref:hypothetical protein n=1 Tax=Pyxidicoccus xibeiensis TaxID=2906759 RepID=UPI0020A7753C|nr:hypothetical protein [Pyxidicoccus xibeiensis]MCP3137068.1 hypothetical protein [Pyxidicoccus xibeiensis]
MAVEVRIPVLVQDPVAAGERKLAMTEWVRVRSEDVVLDGPVSPRVAVLDLDARTGRLRRGAHYQPPEREGEPGTFRIKDLERLQAADVIQVSVFGAVLRTLEMFEEDDALGRRVRWAFQGSQLLVVPQAGEWANAFYQRESHSLQFFYFQHALDHGRQERIYTCHSHDIIAHETAHAVLDGIAPDLHDSLSPQALALHEAVADLTAALASFRCRTLVKQVLEEQGGSIAHSGAFSAIGEQFGRALGDGRGPLRDLLNHKTLKPVPGGKPEDVVTSVEPHALSQVLSGALYGVLVRLHEALKDEFARKRHARASLVTPTETARQVLSLEDAPPEPPLARAGPVSEQARREARRRVSGKALAVAASRLRRSLYRGLDYLPPGEVSFADLGRAIIAADAASHPTSGEQREWLCQEFVRRGIVRDARALHVRTDYAHSALAHVDLDTLATSDWAAYAFANRYRGFLRLPRSTSFHVFPRLVVEKLYYPGGSQRRRVRECIFKVSWKVNEPDMVPGHALPDWRQVTFGTTLAIDCETRRVRALLTSDRSFTRKLERDEMLRWLLDEDLLRMGDEALGPDSRPLATAIRGEVSGGVLRVLGTAHMLHVVEERFGRRAG